MAGPRIKFCGITSLNDARLAVEAGAWAVGMILWPGSERHCDPDEAARDRARAAPPGGDRRRLRQPAAGRRDRARRGDRPDAGAAARRRGAVLLRRGRAPDRRQDHQGRARARRRGRPGDGGVPHRLPPARHSPLGPLRRDRRDVRLGARAAAPHEGPADPVRRAAPRRTWRQRSPQTQPFAVDVASGHRGVARRQGPGEAARVRRGGRTAPRSAACRGGEGGSRIPHRFGPYGGQYVPGDADAGARPSSRRRGSRRARDTGFSAELDGLLRDFVGRPSPLYLARRPQRGRRPRALAQARGPATTPARTRSTTRSARRCWPSAWARRGSSPRPAPASTASHRHRVRAARPGVHRLHGRRGRAPPGAQRPAHGAARRDASCRSRPGPGRSRRPCPRRSATGSRTSARRTTSSARRSARRRTRRSCATCSASSATRRARSCSSSARPAAGARRSPASAAAPTRSAPSRPSSTTPASSWSASRRRGRGSRPAATARR